MIGIGSEEMGLEGNVVGRHTQSVAYNLYQGKVGKNNSWSDYGLAQF